MHALFRLTRSRRLWMMESSSSLCRPDDSDSKEIPVENFNAVDWQSMVEIEDIDMPGLVPSSYSLGDEGDWKVDHQEEGDWKKGNCEDAYDEDLYNEEACNEINNEYYETDEFVKIPAS
ncbi:hypothetical protein N7532_011751 [Penicillium argentinense]|uniref:Uncharacterized protein n=1 Tax=Penicillium argentinense TaxID=1131581 RepID=A0A9W9JV50_9EURO|nr:uncharacterized protein N7532_011751 [Penicillium argentinense]KAJ5082708.1 hypothetical protein N7532_011751 [Penicillium argentinense]